MQTMATHNEPYPYRQTSTDDYFEPYPYFAFVYIWGGQYGDPTGLAHTPEDPSPGGVPANECRENETWIANELQPPSKNTSRTNSKQQSRTPNRQTLCGWSPLPSTFATELCLQAWAGLPHAWVRGHTFLWEYHPFLDYQPLASIPIVFIRVGLIWVCIPWIKKR